MNVLPFPSLLLVLFHEEENSHFSQDFARNQNLVRKKQGGSKSMNRRGKERNHQNEEVIPLVIRNRSTVTIAEIHLPMGE